MIRKAMLAILSWAAITVLVVGPISYAVPVDAHDGIVYLYLFYAPGPNDQRSEKFWHYRDFVLRLDVEWYDGTRYDEIGLPFWALLILLSVYPVIAFVRGPYRRHRRRKKGLCLKCAYDLTGNTSGICPECGCAREFEKRRP